MDCESPFNIKEECSSGKKELADDDGIDEPCVYAEMGCKEILTSGQQEEHENICQYAVCYCPACYEFEASANELYEHFTRDHLDGEVDVVCFQYNMVFRISLDAETEYSLILREEKDGVLFMIHTENEENFRLVSMGCIGAPLKTKFDYDLVARSAESSSLRFRSFTKTEGRYDEDKSSPDPFVVPSAFITSKQFAYELELDVCIWKRDISPAQIKIM